MTAAQEEISAWISDAQAERLAAEAELRRATTRSRMTRQQITDLISAVSDLAATLRGADSETAAEAYRQLGLRLTYYQDKQIVRAAAVPQRWVLPWALLVAGSVASLAASVTMAEPS